MPLRELAARLGDDPNALSAAEWRELARDPRRGARSLYDKLARRAAAERAETERVRALTAKERELRRRGVRLVAGVDEAGMAPLAGPVVAAAVALPAETDLAALRGIDDSKRVEPERREALAAEIRARADAAVGAASPAEIDRENIYQAGLLAMRRAVLALAAPPDHVLVDARRIPDLEVPQTACPQGDAHHLAIAAASIIAKTERDARMRALDRRYPGYGFASHKGYPTPEHQRALRARGPTPVHRRSFPFVRQLIGDLSPAYYALCEALETASGPDEIDAVAARMRAERTALTTDEYRKLRALARRRRAKAGAAVC